MAEIETKDAANRGLRGLHLWHAAMSNCSQRVRLVLAEKHLEWTSHLVDLISFEHSEPDYLAVNPRGLVPTLIHDGRTIIDSHDIIRHIDNFCPEPPLGTENSSEDAIQLFKLADYCQPALRVISHELLFGAVRRLDSVTLERLAKTNWNSDFYQFLYRFSTEGFDDEALLAYLEDLHGALKILDERLGQTEWLSGDNISLTDFSWVVNVHRLTLFDYPLERHKNIQQWLQRLKERPSYQSALTDYEATLPAATGQDLARRNRLFARVYA